MLSIYIQCDEREEWHMYNAHYLYIYSVMKGRNNIYTAYAAYIYIVRWKREMAYV